jgi:hypothetical protein
MTTDPFSAALGAERGDVHTNTRLKSITEPADFLWLHVDDEALHHKAQEVFDELLEQMARADYHHTVTYLNQQGREKLQKGSLQEFPFADNLVRELVAHQQISESQRMQVVLSDLLNDVHQEPQAMIIQARAKFREHVYHLGYELAANRLKNSNLRYSASSFWNDIDVRGVFCDAASKVMHKNGGEVLRYCLGYNSQNMPEHLWYELTGRYYDARLHQDREHVKHTWQRSLNQLLLQATSDNSQWSPFAL